MPNPTPEEITGEHGDVCRHGAMVCEDCAYERGYRDALKKENAKASNQTPEERAAKIGEKHMNLWRCDAERRAAMEKDIAAAIKEAVEEARHKPMEKEEIREREFGCGHDADCSCYADRLRQQARAEAFEQCAKMMDSQIIWTPHHVALLIANVRAAAKEIR